MWLFDSDEKIHLIVLAKNNQAIWDFYFYVCFRTKRLAQ